MDVGRHMMREEQDKFRDFMDALQDLDLAPANTFDGDDDNLFACSYYNRPAKHIDCIGIPPSWLGRMESQMLGLTGTSSDRRAPRLRLRANPRPCRLWERPLPKPLGWRETDPQCREDIRASYGLPSAPAPPEGDDGKYKQQDGASRSTGADYRIRQPTTNHYFVCANLWHSILLTRCIMAVHKNK